MNGNCYFSEGVNPTLTCNKSEGNRVAIPVDDLPTAQAFNRRNVVHDCNGIARTVISSAHSGNEPKVAIPVLTPDRAVKRQNGRRFKEDGEDAFTLTGQDRHGVAVEVDIEPVKMSGHKLCESEDEAHALNCTDQRKVFGANQTRTMVGYNATLKQRGLAQTALALDAMDYKGLSGSNQMMTAVVMCLQSTKELTEQSETLQTASQQEKAEDLADINRKEL